MGEQQPRVGIVMGSDSDWPVMQAAAEALAEFDIAIEADVVSAHRMPEEMLDYGRQAAGRGLAVIIAGAGGAAHLPGMLAALTPLPVIVASRTIASHAAGPSSVRLATKRSPWAPSAPARQRRWRSAPVTTTKVESPPAALSITTTSCGRSGSRAASPTSAHTTVGCTATRWSLHGPISLTDTSPERRRIASGPTARDPA